MRMHFALYIGESDSFVVKLQGTSNEVLWLSGLSFRGILKSNGLSYTV